MKVTADTGTINQRKMTKDKKLEFLSPCQKGIVPAFTESLAADPVDFPGQLWVPVIIDKPVEYIVKNIHYQSADCRIVKLRSISLPMSRKNSSSGRSCVSFLQTVGVGRINGVGHIEAYSRRTIHVIH